LEIRAGGFYTSEIREKGRRSGFEINALTPGLEKNKGILAKTGFKSPHRVGKYGVNLEDMEGIGARALEEALRRSPLIVIDEIGSMEVISRRFQQAVISCLESPRPVLGVIKMGRGPFVDGIKSRSDVKIIDLRRDNFDEVKLRVKNIIEELAKGYELYFSPEKI